MENAAFGASFEAMKSDYLPRQARDKQKEEALTERWGFRCRHLRRQWSMRRRALLCAHIKVWNTSLFEPFLWKNEQFAKTGSGQWCASVRAA
jgi:hypothetical protein